MGAIGVNVITVNLSNKDEFFWEGGVGGDYHMTKSGMLVRKFELKP